jgi:aryl-alcohol dehydrogenase-like predicted oxidoreductase
MIRPDQFRSLGASGLKISPMGIGTNRWEFGKNDDAVAKAYKASLDSGLNFVDTAEIYGLGRSEQLVGACVRKDTRPVIIASKFAPLPWRLSEKQFNTALDNSLSRLGVKAIDLYYVHFPFTLVGIDDLTDWMARAVAAGKIRTVGVSNFNASQMHRAATRLASHKVPLAANQVRYSLLYRKPEKNGVLDACRELNVALVAYRPFEGGQFKPGATSAPANLSSTLHEIAARHGKTIGQVALNWLVKRDEHVIPIPGTTHDGHAVENIDALDFTLSDEEFSALDRASAS